jgi:hypothetical protein
MNLEKDPAAARKTLERICELMPDTHGARMAKQKIAHLPPTRDAFEKQSKPQRIKIAEGVRVGEEAGFYGVPKINDKESHKLLRQYLERLSQYPDDVGARERLAVVYATHFDNANEAITHLTYLLEKTSHKEKKEVEWLKLQATWKVKHKKDIKAARVAIETIVRK